MRNSHISALPLKMDGPIVSQPMPKLGVSCTTLVCVRKDALAAGLTNNITIRTSVLSPMRLIDDICSSSNDNVLASFDRDDDDDDARRMGTNASKLSNCRTKLNTLGAGGPSVAYTPRNVTLSVPYSKATRMKIVLHVLVTIYPHLLVMMICCHSIEY